VAALRSDFRSHKLLWWSRTVNNPEVDSDHILTTLVLGEDLVASLIFPLDGADDNFGVVRDISDDH